MHSVALVIVNLSVYLSVTLVDCAHMVRTYDHDFFTIYGCPMILVI